MRDCSRHHCPNVIQWSAAVGFSSLVGGIVGGLIGATVKHDQWQRLSLAAVRPHVAVRGGQTQLGLAVRF
jgi:hypothetical protein